MREEKGVDVRLHRGIHEDLRIGHGFLFPVFGKGDCLALHKGTFDRRLDGFNLVDLRMVSQFFKLENLLLTQKVPRIERIRDDLAAGPHPASRVVDLPLIRFVIILAFLIGAVAAPGTAVNHIAPGRLFFVERFFKTQRGLWVRGRTHIRDVKRLKYPVGIIRVELPQIGFVTVRKTLTCKIRLKILIGRRFAATDGVICQGHQRSMNVAVSVTSHFTQKIPIGGSA